MRLEYRSCVLSRRAEVTMVAEESFEKQEEEQRDGRGGSTVTLVTGISPLPTVSDIYRQLSSKGILSYYGHDSETAEQGDARTVFDLDHQSPSSSHPSSFTEEKATADPRHSPIKISVVEDGEGTGPGSSLKPSTLRAPRDLRLLAAGEVLRSAGRNAGCVAFLASVVYLAVEGDDFFPSLRLRSIDGRVAALVFLCLGAVAIPFQVVHALSEVRNRRGGGGGRTLVAQMLLRPVTRAKLDELLVQLRDASPYVGVEILPPRRWSVLCCRRVDETNRKLSSVLRYDSWTDATPPTTHGGGSSSSRWVVVCKDYRSSGATTQASIDEELDRFEDSVNLGRRRRRGVSVEFVLDLQEGMSFPDAQAILVHPSALEESRFYSFRTYFVLLCLCLDSVYNALFYVVTKRLPDKRIVKIIRRNVGHRT